MNLSQVLTVLLPLVMFLLFLAAAVVTFLTSIRNAHESKLKDFNDTLYKENKYLKEKNTYIEDKFRKIEEVLTDHNLQLQQLAVSVAELHTIPPTPQSTPQPPQTPTPPQPTLTVSSAQKDYSPTQSLQLSAAEMRRHTMGQQSPTSNLDSILANSIE